MKLAFSTNAFTRFGLVDALRAIKSAGFAAAEILADQPHAYPPAMSEQFADEVRRELDRLGLAVSNVNANCTFGYWRHAPPEPFFEPSLISPVAQYRADRIDMILRTLDFARAVGAANISITTGRLLGGMPPQRAGSVLEQSLRPILDRADALGLGVGIECEPGLFVEWAAELRELIDRLGHPRLGANLDVGHSQVLGESIPDAIRLLKGRIWNIHVEDIRGRKHYHLIPGEGTMDWRALRAALLESAYDRHLTVELYTCADNPHEAAQRSYGFLSRVMA